MLKRAANHYSNGRPRTVFLCKCDCGKFKEIAARSLIKGLTCSCGCFHSEKVVMRNAITPYRSIFNTLLASAKRAKREVRITFEEFLQFTAIKNCFYCDDVIAWNRTKRVGESFGYYLDRKDASIGYTKDNCVVCCKRCNQAKSNTFTFEEWVHIGRTIKEFRHRNICS